MKDIEQTHESEQVGKQTNLAATDPEFSSTLQGYDMQQVDTYIDELRAKNELLMDVNWQLFMFLSFEMEDLKQKDWELSETSALYWKKINKLIERPANPRKLDDVINMKKMAEVSMTKQKPRKKSLVTGILFYLSLVVVVMSVYLFGLTNPNQAPRNLLGFSIMTVVTRSMQDDIPQNSLVITRRVTDPTTIEVGEDITYLRPNNTTVTHRVVGIVENYSNTGLPGFETQGIMNPRPDAEIVPATNVVGRVVFTNLPMGQVVRFIQSNIIIVTSGLALIITSLILLRKFVFPVIFQNSKKNALYNE